MNILIIDDSKFIRSHVKKILESLNHQVFEAEDGEKGVEALLKPNQFDLVLLDWNMPNLDGPGVLQEVEKKIHAPIVMMTTESAPEKIRMALELGAKEYIMKPFTDDVLQEKIDYVIGEAV